MKTLRIRHMGHSSMLLALLLLLLLLLQHGQARAKQQHATNTVRQFGGGGGGFGYPSHAVNTPGCPLCDASVYSYCSHKMIHDACCCDFPALPQQQQLRPPQCIYFDCSLLYAKSCYEHALIKNCCCNNPY